MAKYKCKISKNPTRKLQQGGQLNYPEWQDQIFTSMTPLYEKGGVQEQSIGSSFPIVDKKDATVEAEKGELILTTDNELYKIGGRTHEKGGSPIAAQQGDFIYSDNVLIKGKDLKALLPKIKENSKIYKKGITPAKLASKYLDLNQYKALEENDDPKERKTAMRMQDNYMRKLAEIAFMQEFQKGMKNGLPERFMEYIPFSQDSESATTPLFKNGGVVYKKYEPGGRVDIPVSNDPLKSESDNVSMNDILYQILGGGEKIYKRIMENIKAAEDDNSKIKIPYPSLAGYADYIRYGSRAKELTKIFESKQTADFVKKIEEIYSKGGENARELANKAFEEFISSSEISSIVDPLEMGDDAVDDQGERIVQTPGSKRPSQKPNTFKTYPGYTIPKGLTPEIFYAIPGVKEMLEKDTTFSSADDYVWGPEHDKVWNTIKGTSGLNVVVDEKGNESISISDDTEITNPESTTPENTGTETDHNLESGDLGDPSKSSFNNKGSFTADDIGIAGALLQAFMPKYIAAPSREQVDTRYVENQKLSDRSAVNDILNTVNRAGQQLQSSLNPQVAAAIMSGMMGNAFENIGQVKSNFANANAQMLQQADSMNAQIFNNASSMNAQLNARYDEDVAKYHQAKLNQKLKDIQVATNALSTGSYNDYMNKMLQTSGLADDYIITPQGIQHLGNKKSMYGDSQDQSDSYQSYYDEAMNMTDEELEKSRNAHIYAANKRKLGKSKKTKK